jgi:hypothetical protein
MPKSFPDFSLVYDSNLHIRRYHANHAHCIHQNTNPSRNFDNDGGVKGYCLDTDESVLSTTDEEPPTYEEGDGVFCDDRLSEGTWVGGERKKLGD